MTTREWVLFAAGINIGIAIMCVFHLLAEDLAERRSRKLLAAATRKAAR